MWGPGKSPRQVAAILQALARRQHVALATRVEPDQFEAIRAMLPAARYNHVARIVSFRQGGDEFGYNSSGSGEGSGGGSGGQAAAADALPLAPPPPPRLPGSVCIVSAGTADLSVVEECRVVAEAAGCTCAVLPDCGVAGIHRLLARLPAVRAADVVVVVAGMDGALPSVVAGLVEAPVVRVCVRASEFV